jgi:type IV secretion system protein VirD4
MLASDDNIIEGVQQTPTAIFLIVPDEKTSYHNLVSLFIKQSYEYFIYSAQNDESASTRLRINYILDEFSSLPTINDFPAMITAARSRDIRFTLFVQSKHQLDLRYKEEAETIRANCNNWIFLVSREVDLLQELSTLCGTRRLSDGVIVPTLSITELQRLDKEKGEALILCGRQKPFISRLLDIKSYDGDGFKKPIRIIQEREQYEIEFKFKPSVKSSIFDWPTTTNDIEHVSNKPNTLSSSFDSFFERLSLDNLDKPECNSLPEQPNEDV